MASKLANLEALLYVAGDNGLEEQNLIELLEVDGEELGQLVTRLQQKMKADPDSGMQIIHIANTYKMTTSQQTAKIIEKYFQKDLTKNLSQSALEILSIIAYRQPITRIEIDDIRGVNSSGALQTLIWRGLIKQDGKKDAPGHPKLYVTTDYFLQYFNYQSLADLPLIEDFEDTTDGEEIDLFDSKGSADKHLEKEGYKMAERLQKVIAEAGIASRRKAEKMIVAGRVKVDGHVVTKLGTKVDTFSNITVDDEPIERESLHTYLFYKPRGVVSTAEDDRGRKTVVDYFEDLPYRLYPVGRLDYDTSGLLLMTNDGKLANLLMHPKNEVAKVYVAKIKGILTPDEIKTLTQGVKLDHFKAAPAKVKVLKTDHKKDTQIVQITIHEGHYHQVKRMFKAVGHLVDKLAREKYAFLTLDSLTSGQYRELSKHEVDKLMQLN